MKLGSKRRSFSNAKVGIGVAAIALLGAACVEPPPAQPSGPGILPAGESVYALAYDGSVFTSYKLTGDGNAGITESFTSETAPPLPDYLSDGLNLSDRNSDRRIEVDQRPADRTVSIVEGPAASPSVVSSWDDDYSVGSPGGGFLSAPRPQFQFSPDGSMVLVRGIEFGVLNDPWDIRDVETGAVVHSFGLSLFNGSVDPYWKQDSSGVFYSYSNPANQTWSVASMDASAGSTEQAVTVPSGIGNCYAFSWSANDRIAYSCTGGKPVITADPAGAAVRTYAGATSAPVFVGQTDLFAATNSSQAGAKLRLFDDSTGSSVGTLLNAGQPLTWALGRISVTT